MKKDNSTLILLLLAGFGIYWYYKHKNKPTVTNVTNNNTSTVAQDTSMVMPSIEQGDVNIRYTINGFKKFGNVPNTI
jgi:lipopolysaccharide export system protein LptC